MMNAASQASTINDRYCLVLGAAALDLWSNLPQGLQGTLFERAVVLGHRGERDESLREQLAKFLHDHHPRTQQGQGSDKAPLGRGVHNH
jgi:hypothetical protein